MLLREFLSNESIHHGASSLKELQPSMFPSVLCCTVTTAYYSHTSCNGRSLERRIHRNTGPLTGWLSNLCARVYRILPVTLDHAGQVVHVEIRNTIILLLTSVPLSRCKWTDKQPWKLSLIIEKCMAVSIYALQRLSCVPLIPYQNS